MKTFLIGSVVLVSLLVGCKSTGGICCKGEDGEIDRQEQQMEILLDPVAVLDNRTDDNYYYFSCKNSYDRDENNQSIDRCDWIVTRSGDGVETTTKEFNSTNEINISKYIDTTTGYLVNIKLIVTDDENQTDTNETNFTMMF